MLSIHFTVAGLPAPQGSKNRWGSEDNKRTKPWREAVASDATYAMNGREIISGPVKVHATFFFPRPKSHYRTGKRSHELRDDAPRYVATKPDLDKLQRAVGDAITGIVVRDDSQIVCWISEKRYGDPVRASISVRNAAP